MRKLTFVFFVSAVLSPALFAFSVTPRTIYEIDNRNEIYTSPVFVQDLSESIAAQIPNDYMKVEKDHYKISASFMGKDHCPTVRFADQMTASRCSGFLVAPNVIATAGHCMVTQEECDKYKWIFDYKLKNANDKSYQNVAKENVFSCKKILAQKLEYLGGTDYALIELDRKVDNRIPVAVDLDNEVSNGAPIYMIGFPSGIPMKYTDSSTIFDNSQKVFKSKLDVFAGNSGSAVFDAVTNKVIGIVSMGTGDWTWNDKKTCKVEKICKEGDKCESNLMAKLNFFKAEFEAALKAAAAE